MKFSEYRFEDSEEWRRIEANLEFPAGMSADKRAAYLLKRKARFFKATVDPSFDVSSVTRSSARAKPAEEPAQSIPKNAKRQPEPAEDFARQRRIRLNYGILLCELLSLLLAVGYVFAPASISQACHLLHIAGYVCAVVRDHGLPRGYSLAALKTYLTQVAVNQVRFSAITREFVYIMLSPSLYKLLPGAIEAVLFAAPALDAALPMHSKRVHAMLQPYLRAVVPRQSQWRLLAAQSELVVLGVAIARAILYRQDLIGLFVLSQLTRVRHMMSPASRQAWSTLRLSLDKLVLADAVPATIKSTYTRFCDYLYR
ncbi:MAG: hypothetical protein MHM6MM_001162 [Cercozoa sp. M6MM]